jgi:hypothetical protein
MIADRRDPLGACQAEVRGRDRLADGRVEGKVDRVGFQGWR